MHNQIRPSSPSALLVIDVQESFRKRPYWSDENIPKFLAATQRIIDACTAHAIPVVQILHTEEAGAFAIENGYVRALEGLRIEPAAVFHKKHHSAFAGTDLQAWLIARGIGRVFVTGIRTEQCCETTTRNASDLGFQVDYLMDATLTFAMTHPTSGRTYLPSEIKAHTELVLAGRFARIRGVDELIEELSSEAAELIALS